MQIFHSTPSNSLIYYDSFSPLSLSPLLVAYCVCASRVPDERVVLLLLVGVSVSLYLPYKFSLKWWIN